MCYSHFQKCYPSAEPTQSSGARRHSSCWQALPTPQFTTCAAIQVLSTHCPAIIVHFLRPFTSLPSWIIKTYFLFSTQTSNTSSPIFTLSSWPWLLFLWENRNWRELPQVPTNTSTRPPASGPKHTASSPVTRGELSMFQSKTELSSVFLRGFFVIVLFY